VFKRQRFGDVISRQLDLFERGSAALILACAEAEAAYDRAERDEAEERFGDYQDLVETGTEELANLRDHFAATLGEAAAEQYEAEFNQAVRRRLPRFALEIENT
jgi:aminoglycoside phosphotransferase family enzyme